MNNKTVIAIMYDFDKTLCSKDMQEYSFIPELGVEASEFWESATALTKEGMDSILAYMYLMIKKASANDVCIRRNSFVKLGKDIELFPGVSNYFKRINEYGASLGLKIEHYIISSGLKEIIEGTSIASEFKQIFACEFFYDVNGVAKWPKMAVNYTAKTQFLFRINKGCLKQDENLNKFTPDDERRVPFRNMIYVGDGLTDVPCMKLVKVNGGQSIAVHQDDKSMKIAKQLLNDHRVDFIAKADYSDGSEYDRILKLILDKMKNVNQLVNEHHRQEKMAAKK
ncbi:MAG: haloacid dehalogenase-like hydrolase [Erysipelotrichaceae bacterium]